MKHALKQFLLVLKFELESYFKNKSFVLTTLILALAIVGVVIVPTLIPGFLGNEEDVIQDGDMDENSDINGEDSELLGIYIKSDAGVEKEFIETSYPATWVTYEDVDAMKNDVENLEIDAGFVVETPTDITYIVNDLGLYDYLGNSICTSLSESYRLQYLLDRGLTQEEIWEADSFYVNLSTEVLGKDSGENYWYTYILVFVVYFLIIFYGQMIATSVTVEKSNRAIEILVTSVSSNSLICGKVLAGAIAGVSQAAIILGSGFVSYGLVKDAWGGMLDFLFHIPTSIWIVYIIFSVLSYLLYAFIYGMLGALVSKTEDISKSATPVAMIYVASSMVAMFGLVNDSNSTLMKVASYIPFSSGNAMFVRVSMASVELWEVLISAGILVASCVIAGVLAAKIFRFGTLHYGNPIKLVTALKKAKD